ncbi:MAG: hypothetical protein ABR575_04105 [Actinomycetota bacterium]
MTRRILVALIVAPLFVGAYAHAAPAGRLDYAFAGEGRALDLSVLGEGVTLGLTLASADSTPSAQGVAAAQCTLVADDPEPGALPCSVENTSKSRYPGDPGSGDPTCTASLPEPLNAVVTLDVACGNSTSGIAGRVPWTKNQATVARLGTKLPVQALVPVTLPATEQLVDDLTGALQPVLDQTPAVVHDAVDNVVGLLDDLAETDLLKAEIGTATSTVSTKGAVTTVDSLAAPARIGLVGIPSVTADGTAISGSADPLTNGLVIIEVSQAEASASLNRTAATADSAATAALVTVKIRDVTKTEPSYVTVTVADGETVTVLNGTPAESTITAAGSSTKVTKGSAVAAADAVRLHLLKGVNGGVVVGLGRATAAVTKHKTPAPPPQPEPRKRPPTTLPVTGGVGYEGLALGLLVAAGLILAARRRAAR